MTTEAQCHRCGKAPHSQSGWGRVTRGRLAGTNDSCRATAET